MKDWALLPQWIADGLGRIPWPAVGGALAFLVILGTAWTCYRRVGRRLRRLEEATKVMGDALEPLVREGAVLGRGDALAVLRDTLRQAQRLPRPGMRIARRGLEEPGAQS